MARATAAGALKLSNGIYPPGTDATSYGNLVAHADYLVDTEALPGVLSTTGTNEIALGDEVLRNLVNHGVWTTAGGDLSGKVEPVVMTNAIKSRIKQLLMDPIADGWDTLDQIDESA